MGNSKSNESLDGDPIEYIDDFKKKKKDHNASKSSAG